MWQGYGREGGGGEYVNESVKVWTEIDLDPKHLKLPLAQSQASQAA